MGQTKTRRIQKRITVVSPMEMKQKFSGQTFRSYGAVARQLSCGEKVIVAVAEGLDDFFVCSGFGGVEKVDDSRWYEPRRLTPEF